jgi:hypothetical protein
MPKKKKEPVAKLPDSHWEKIAADALVWVNQVRYALLEPPLEEWPPVIKDPTTGKHRSSPLSLCFPRIERVDDLGVFFKNKADAVDVRRHLGLPAAKSNGYGQEKQVPLNDAARKFIDGWLNDSYPHLKLDAPPPPKPKPAPQYVEFDTIEQAVASGLRHAVVKQAGDTAIKMPPLQIGSIFHYDRKAWRIDKMQFGSPSGDRVEATATGVDSEGKSVSYFHHFYNLAFETKLPIDFTHVAPYEGPTPLKLGDKFTFSDREYQIQEIRKCLAMDGEGHRVVADDLKLMGMLGRVFSNFERETGLTVVETEPETPPNERILVVSPAPTDAGDTAAVQAIEQRNQNIADALVETLTGTVTTPAAPSATVADGELVEDTDEDIPELAPKRRDQSLLNDFLDYVTDTMEIDWSEVADLVVHDLDNPTMPAPWQEAARYFLDWCEEHFEGYIEDEEE